MPEKYQDIFNIILNQYTENQTTHFGELVSAAWKIRRLWAIETGLRGKTGANRPARRRAR
jgi:hypothetical protein